MLQRVMIPVADAFKAGGIGSLSGGYKLIRQGTFPDTVVVGKRASVPSDELQAVINARVAGATDDQLRALVQRLHAARANAFGGGL